MDSLVAAAARALATGDPLGALNHVALRGDPPALALRGIAMAQLGEFPRARALLREAARGFGTHEWRNRARCIVAEAEVALAMRDLRGAPPGLASAIEALDRRGDAANALHGRLVAVRRELLLGRVHEAAALLPQVAPRSVPPALAAVAALAAAEIALRRLDVAAARPALAIAAEAAHHARIPALAAEAAEAATLLERPAARLASADGDGRPLRLDEVAAIRSSAACIVDACRREIRGAGTVVPLARRPILFSLLLGLALAWPAAADRGALIARVFRIRRPDETHRARLRVEVGRLRRLVSPFAAIDATAEGFVLRPHDAAAVLVLLPPFDGGEASLVALLADGAAWSAADLAMALDASQRTVQRALVDLEAAGRVRCIGQGRSRRWLAPALLDFTTLLLLPGSASPE